MTRRSTKEERYLCFLSFFKGEMILCSPSKAMSNSASSLGRNKPKMLGVHSFRKQLLSICCVPRTVLGTGDIRAQKRQKLLSWKHLCSWEEPRPLFIPQP